MHLVRNSNCVKTTPKEVLKRYLTQYGHVKIIPDFRESVEKVPGYMCYRFQHFISKGAATGKMNDECTINRSSCIVGLKTEHMLLPKRYSLLKKFKLSMNK